MQSVHKINVFSGFSVGSCINGKGSLSGTNLRMEHIILTECSSCHQGENEEV